jgi:hypothetical protein
METYPEERPKKGKVVRAVGGKILAWSCLLATSIGMSGLMAISQPIYQANPPVPVQQPHPNQNGKLNPADIKLPDSVKQGEVLKVRVTDTSYLVRNATPDMGSVVFAGRKAPFFQQPDGTFLALLPVSVFQKPGSYPLEVHDPNGPVVQTLQVAVIDGRYRTQNVNVSKSTAGLQPLPGEMEAIQALKDTLTPIRYWQEPFISPTVDCQNSPFGVKRYHNGQPTGDYHKGVDLRSPQGSPIKAINGGKVQIARMYRLHGGTVGLDHGQGVGSIYIHMSKVAVQPGEQVKKGDVIGYVGSTGFATGPHLHWGMYVSGLPVNPNQWITDVPVCN